MRPLSGAAASSARPNHSDHPGPDAAMPSHSGDASACTAAAPRLASTGSCQLDNITSMDGISCKHTDTVAKLQHLLLACARWDYQRGCAHLLGWQRGTCIWTPDDKPAAAGFLALEARPLEVRPLNQGTVFSIMQSAKVTTAADLVITVTSYMVTGREGERE